MQTDYPSGVNTLESEFSTSTQC